MVPMLRFLDYPIELFIKTNVSQVVIGDALTQDYGDKIQLQVANAFQSLNTKEQRYSPTSREGLAVIWAVKYFISYILRMPFKIFTGHLALVTLKTKENVTLQGHENKLI